MGISETKKRRPNTNPKHWGALLIRTPTKKAPNLQKQPHWKVQVLDMIIFGKVLDRLSVPAPSCMESAQPFVEFCGASGEVGHDFGRHMDSDRSCLDPKST